THCLTTAAGAPVARFSTVAGERGAADAERDIRRLFSYGDAARRLGVNHQHIPVNAPR
uniref:Catalase-1 (Fragments) n=1 Tax=Comamonas terrigena TaxID=32013 RepID=CAT1_COMTR|nr:RecName: Full=Catalase-1 [Comamonas terrigena]